MIGSRQDIPILIGLILIVGFNQPSLKIAIKDPEKETKTITMQTLLRLKAHAISNIRRKYSKTYQ